MAKLTVHEGRSGRWVDLIRKNPRGEPLATFFNAELALREAPEWAGRIAYDEFSMRVVLKDDPPWEVQLGAVWGEHHDRQALKWLQAKGILVNEQVLSSAVRAVAIHNTINPLKAYLEGLKWDGTKRVGQWLTLYLGVEQSAYARAVGERWMISAVARAFRPGCKVDCCLILEGPQDAGKSTALRTLGNGWFTDELDDMGSKDSCLQLLGAWIIELSELTSISRSDVARIKAFMSRTTDRFRPPYGRQLVEQPRRCVFAGTVNHGAYLRDETGARRFWPVECGTIDLESLGRDRDQLWAESVQRFRDGASWWLDTPELRAAADGEQRVRFESDAWDELIQNWLEAEGLLSVSLDEILERCLKKDRSLWTQSDKIRISKVLSFNGWERFNAASHGKTLWRYRRVPAPPENFQGLPGASSRASSLTP